jgi:MoaA/NifB/PqqE/SkfB family radical SAM enzyme
MTSDALYSQLRKGNRIELADASPLPAPMAIYLEPTNICNFKCVYCPESCPDYKERTGGLHRLDAAGFSAVMDQILALGRLKVLHFYMMGEPFVNRALPDFIRMASDRRVADRTCVTTNATLIDAKTTDRILASGLDYLRVSIYGGTEETFARRTGSPFKLQRIVNNVAAFRRTRDERGLAKPFIYVKMIETGDDAEDARFLDTFRPLADEVALEPVMNWNDPDEGNLAQLSREEMLANPYFRHVKRVCSFPFYTLVVHSDLRVSVCCVDWAKQAVVGDLKIQTLGEIWRGERLRDFRLTHLRGERRTLPACAQCTYLYTAPDNLDALSPETYLARCSAVDGER